MIIILVISNLRSLCKITKLLKCSKYFLKKLYLCHGERFKEYSE